jgi:hypothetical protein
MSRPTASEAPALPVVATDDTKAAREALRAYLGGKKP